MSENAYFALVYSCIMSNSIVIVLSVTLPCCLYMCYSIWASWERLLTIMLENLVSLPRKSGSPLYPQNIRHSSPGCPTAIFLLAQGQWKVLQGGWMARRNGQAEPGAEGLLHLCLERWQFHHSWQFATDLMRWFSLHSIHKVCSNFSFLEWHYFVKILCANTLRLPKSWQFTYPWNGFSVWQKCNFKLNCMGLIIRLATQSPWNFKYAHFALGIWGFFEPKIEQYLLQEKKISWADVCIKVEDGRFLSSKHIQTLIAKLMFLQGDEGTGGILQTTHHPKFLTSAKEKSLEWGCNFW